MGGLRAAGRMAAGGLFARTAGRAALAAALLAGSPLGAAPEAGPGDAPGRQAIGQARDWDEIRVAEVDPNRISTFTSVRSTQAGFTGLSKVFYFRRDWLRIAGAAEDETFVSSKFKFVKLDYPHEWSARVTDTLGETARLRVGPSCRCSLSGISAYKKEDNTHWLRLEFSECEACESTAKRAAVVVPLRSDSEQDSNLYRWMCAISDHELCAEAQAATSTSTTSTATATVTTTTTSSACHSQNMVGVTTKEDALGMGRCQHGTDVKPDEPIVAPNQAVCQTHCDLTYALAVAMLTGAEEGETIQETLSKQPNVCKAYSFNAGTQECIIYRGDRSDLLAITDGNSSWQCVSNVQADQVNERSHIEQDCPTAHPTETATTTTATTTSHQVPTPAPKIAKLSLRSLFAVSPEEGQCYSGGPDGTQAHFAERGSEATLLQLQSRCFRDVDYYMMGAALPVAQEHWDKVVLLLGAYGDTRAWVRRGVNLFGTCEASVSVDRLPVEADYVGHSGPMMWQGKERAALSLAAPALLGLVGCAGALKAKDMLGVSGAPRCWLLSTGIVAAVLTAVFTYYSGQFISWVFKRLAVKQFVYGGSGSLYCAAPMLSDSCLPVAVATAFAVAVLWMSPRKAASTSRQPGLNSPDIHLRYHPETNGWTSMAGQR